MDPTFLRRGTSFWLQEKILTGEQSIPTDGGILIIGAGLSGVSAAYWLIKNGVKEVTMVDFQPETAASYRNCGHILYGAVESFEALTAIHGKKKAESIQNFSVEICDQMRRTILDLCDDPMDCEYKQNGYYVLSISQSEQKEIESSAHKLNKLGYKNELLTKIQTERLGFRNCFGARYEHGSAKAHPVKFRNKIQRDNLNNGVKYHSQIKIESIDASLDEVKVRIRHGGEVKVISFDAAIICANAYSPLFSDFFSSRSLIEPFKGQIITSSPLEHQFQVTSAHSFNHGYEYALITEDNRLMIGGWRDNTPTKEIGNYEITPNEEVERGLIDFTYKHYDISEKIKWDFSWSGIMAASKTGFPFIGPTIHPLVYSCTGYTGHGFSWAHGSAKLCVDIMLGKPVPKVATLFNPMKN